MRDKEEINLVLNRLLIIANMEPSLAPFPPDVYRARDLASTIGWCLKNNDSNPLQLLGGWISVYITKPEKCECCNGTGRK